MPGPSVLNDIDLEVQTPPAPKKAAPLRKPGLDVFRRVSTKDLCRMTRQLSALLHAGMPLVPALTALAEQWQSPTHAHVQATSRAKRPLAAIMEDVRDDVNEGGSLAEALRRHPGLFSPLFVSMVSAG